MITTEELTLRLNDLGYEPLLTTLKAIDPDLYQVIEALSLVRNHKFGTVTVEVYRGRITLITPALKIHIQEQAAPK